MKAGRELDALIAEKVFGEDVAWYSDGPDETKDPCTLWDNRFLPIANYSTDIKDAWEVADRAKINAVIRLKDGRWIARIDEPAELEDYYEVSTYQSGRSKFSVAETVPLSICLAALAAIENDVTSNR